MLRIKLILQFVYRHGVKVNTFQRCVVITEKKINKRNLQASMTKLKLQWNE